MSIKNQFFESFTTELILNSIDPWERKRLEEKREKIQGLKKEMKKLLDEMNVKFKEKEFQQAPQQYSPSLLPASQPTEEFQVQPKIQQEQIQQSAPEQYEGLKKIEQMLEDKSIASVECPGPRKFVILRRGHRRFPTRISLNKDEINEILNYFSEQSRIPRIGGVFKTIVDNLVITAIDSNYGGPRFIITKTRG
ncbi:MAG: hypothetical protein U9Q06_01020 [Nanoarchaeota archaeon]|nr:hypothetical protein [Nanoarchaeota archaeon]